MLRIDERGVGGLRRVVPFTGRLFAARILSGGDDF
jgi:hypothetical protein